jgi:two-component system response regulator AtoC
LNSPVAMQSLADVHTQPFVVIDADLRVRLVNRAFEETYGVTRAGAVGQRCYQLLHTGGPRPCPCGPDGAHCPFKEVFTGTRDQVAVNTYEGELGVERLVRIQGHPLQTESGEILLGELIRADEPADTEMDEADAGPRMVGDSGLFRQILGRLRLAARSAAPILLEGATGTGKELAADYIHRHSARAQGPFVTLDCTTLGEDLFESEVFGHERGAFTGSVGERQGLFERADGGTLFLDEIGEMPLTLQAKLLRALESGEFRRLGSDLTRRADVRVVCATNRNLRDHPGFRQDLYFRIACVRVRMPALAQRTEDIPALARELLVRIGASANRTFEVDAEALTLLQAQSFPGNIRELRNVLWVAAMHSSDGRIDAPKIALALHSDPAGDEAAPTPPGMTAQLSSGPSPLTLRDLESRHVRDLLATHGGNRRTVASALKVSERTLYRKLKRYGLS